jgi:hypothetical protein
MTALQSFTTSRYANVIAVSKRVRWEIERDVIRGRSFDFTKPFLPDGLSLVNELDFLTADDRRLLSQVQGRTYTNIFGLAERFIGAKILEISKAHWLGDQVALEALVRFTDEELKHQALFRRIEEMLAAAMPPGYVITAEPNLVAKTVLGKCTWAVLALTLDIELFTQVHYRASIAPQDDIDPLWKDVFLFHWKEESQHAILDELELLREDQRLDRRARSVAVEDLIGLVAALDGVLRAQAEADAGYFARIAVARFTPAQQAQVHHKILKAYRWQYIVSGVTEPRFRKVLFGLLEQAQANRIEDALAPLVYATPLRASVQRPRALKAAA